MLLCRRRALGTVVYKSEAPCSVNKSYIFTFFVHVGGEPMLPQWYTSQKPRAVLIKATFSLFLSMLAASLCYRSGIQSQKPRAVLIKATFSLFLSMLAASLCYRSGIQSQK